MKARLTREDWLDLGLRQLSDGGAEAVKLAPMLQAAGVTRGSFYHHFEDHGVFLTAMTQHWIKTQTDDLLDRLPTDASPEDTDRVLTELAMQIDYHVELGIREVSRRVPDVAAIVQRADATRLEVLTGLYAKRFGITRDRAATAAKLEYATYVGLILIDSEIDETTQRMLAQTYADMMDAYFRAGENP